MGPAHPPLGCPPALGSTALVKLALVKLAVVSQSKGVAQGPAQPGSFLLLRQQHWLGSRADARLELMQVLAQHGVFAEQPLLLLEQGLQPLPEFVLKNAGKVFEQGLHRLQLLPGSGQLPLQLLGR